MALSGVCFPRKLHLGALRRLKLRPWDERPRSRLPGYEVGTLERTMPWRTGMLAGDAVETLTEAHVDIEFTLELAVEQRHIGRQEKTLYRIGSLY